jgi:hypothetical protein
MSLSLSRRSLLRFGAAAALAYPLSGMLRTALAGDPSKRARRVIFFYFPDGVPEPNGGPGKWHPSGSETNFALSDDLAPLAPFKGDCVFFRGLSLGPTGSGSHPAGAKKLLTAVDEGNGESIDRYLARTVGASAPFKHLYLGAMAAQNNASGDKFISYPSAGTTVAPEDNPLAAFQRVFGNGVVSGGSGAGAPDPAEVSVLDAVMADLDGLRARAGDAEKAKLDLYAEALRDVERRVKGMGLAPLPSCSQPTLDSSGVNVNALYDPATFPSILRAQLDVMVQALACGMTKVGVIQCSQHTSELIMSRFANTPMYRPNFDMRSHQASHYGVPSDPKFYDYSLQRAWWMSQVAYLLGELKKRPEGQGTMLDFSLVLVCSEVSDGNTHSHDDMPFVLAGGGGGSIRTGRLLQFSYRRHADLLVSIANAMGDGIPTFGQDCAGAIPGLLA